MFYFFSYTDDPAHAYTAPVQLENMVQVRNGVAVHQVNIISYQHFQRLVADHQLDKVQSANQAQNLPEVWKDRRFVSC